MQITSLVLVGYRRMLLCNIQRFEMKLKEMVQLILGTNGSGKSSLIDMLTPLPPDPTAFKKDGRKIITIQKHGRQYVCESWFAPSAKHSFKIDGEELNSGGTAKVQKDLCKQHFSITPESHDLMRGEDKFTRMSPAKRREWLTLLCDTDYTFAMDAHDKLRERHNVLKGGLKTTQKHLVVETAKIISLDEINNLEQETASLLQELQALNLERIPLEHSSKHFSSERDRALQILSDTSMRLIKSRVIAPFEYLDGQIVRDDWGQLKRAHFNSVEEVESEIDRFKHLVTAKEATVVALMEQHTKQQRNFDILSKTGQDGVATLTTKLQALQEARHAKASSLRLGLIITNPRGASEAFNAIEADLIEVLSALPSNADRRFGKARLQTIQTELFGVAEKRNHLSGEMAKAQAKKDHADDHRESGKMTCPQCTHSWVLGINEQQYAKLTQQLDTWHEQLKTLTDEQINLTAAMQEIEQYFAQYRQFMTYTKSVAVLQALWEHLLTNQLVLDSPLEAINAIRLFKRDVEIAVELEDVEKSIEETKKLRLQAEEVGDASLSEVQTNLEQLTVELGRFTAEMTVLQRNVASYTEYRRQLKAGQALAEEVKRLYQLVHDHQYAHVEAFRRECILHCIAQVEQVLALKQEALRHAKMQKAIVTSLEVEMEKLTLQEEAAKMMVTALSPTNGLIAEGLLGFIHAFVGQMNAFIKNVWTYPLQIIPTGYSVDNGEQSSELNYRFKVVVGDNSEVVDDVSFGSRAQREIVDMAFRLAAMQYLGLSEAPIFLDEPGNAMDDSHRFALSTAIKSLVDNYNHSQLVLISHDVSIYGSFPNAEICVLDANNVVLPSNRKYNQHVIIN